MSDKTEERAPLLSYEQSRAIMTGEETRGDVADAIREWYEDKITSGELRVVKTVICENTGKDEAWCEWLKCPCGESTPLGSNFCPGCGARIAATG